MLDYHVEVLHANSERWMCGPSLPLPCLAHTSTVVGGEWYLMDQHNGAIQHANINTYIAMATGKHTHDRTRSESNNPNPPLQKHRSMSESDKPSSPRYSPPVEMIKNRPISMEKCNGATASICAALPLNDMPHSSCSLWKKLPTTPPHLPFKIASTNSHLLALSSSNHNMAVITTHIHQDDHWVRVEGRFPGTLSSGLLLGGQRDQDTLYVMGGQVSHHYTNSAHKSTLTSVEKLKVIKKNRQLTLISD